MNNAIHFLGHDGFIWFVGVVEDRADPTFTGRVRVRCLGYHTEDKLILPTADLPWAAPVLPITSSGISGIGQTPLGLVEGSWVFGFFRDSDYAQEPVIMGSLPGRPSEGAYNTGFYDPYGAFPRKIDEPDVNRLAVNDPDKPADSLVLRKATRITGVPTAMFDGFNIVSGLIGQVAGITGIATEVITTVVAASGLTGWDQPEIAYAAKYPYNHVYESESGHILEFDDTPGAERVYLAHWGGSSIEFNPNLDRVDITKGSHYTLTGWDNKISIDGDSDITIDGRHKVYINKGGLPFNNYDIQVGPNANLNIQVDRGNINLVSKTGDINVTSGGNYNLTVGGHYSCTVAGKHSTSVGILKSSTTIGADLTWASRIELNPPIAVPSSGPHGPT